MTDTQIHASDRFPGLLKTWRARRRLSQLDLALAAGMSQRHVSFLETGRSRPSRYAVAQLGEALNMPAAEMDAMLVTAGFAAHSSDARWSEETRDAVWASIDHVLAGHEPYPALAIDRMWNLLRANESARAFFGAIGGGGDPNVLRGLMMPGPVREAIGNWPEVVRALMRLHELEVARRPNDREAQALLDELLKLPGVRDAVESPVRDLPAPVLAIAFEHRGAQLKLFSLIATIGMSADAAIDDIRLETLLPADEATRTWFATNIGSAN